MCHTNIKCLDRLGEKQDVGYMETLYTASSIFLLS